MIIKFKEIIDYRSNKSVVSKEDGFINPNNVYNFFNKTTQGYQVLVELRDEMTTWMYINDVKESIPIELSEYAVTNKITMNQNFPGEFHIRRRKEIYFFLRKIPSTGGQHINMVFYFLRVPNRP